MELKHLTISSQVEGDGRYGMVPFRGGWG